MAGDSWRTCCHGSARNAGHGYAARTDGSYAWYAYAGADGSTAESEGRRVRPLISDRDDSAPQWRTDHGKGIVRHRRGGAGCRNVRLCDGCGHRAARRDQNYADVVGAKALEEKR